jgi:diguanylate cyclase
MNATTRHASLQSLLTELLHRLDLGVRSAHEIGRLVARIDEGIAEDQWGKLLAEVARLIDDAMGVMYEKNRDLERFLRELSMQLGDLAQVHDNGSTDAAPATLYTALHRLRVESDRLRAELLRERERLMKDALTGIPSRFAYNIRLQSEFANWQRYRRPLSYVVLDVDHFHAINEAHGHRVGDHLLQQLAKLLASHVRQSDFIARTGGEEFVLLLPETGAGDAFVLAEKLRDLIAATRFAHGGGALSLTVSVGVTQFNGKDTLAEVYARADAALHKARTAGRNRCAAG